MKGTNAVDPPWDAQWPARTMVSSLICTRNSRTRRDLPMPGSPTTCTISSSPARIRAKAEASAPSSRRRPISGVVSDVLSCSSRSAVPLIASTRQTRTGASNPLRSCSPSAWKVAATPASLWETGPTTTVFCSAIACSRAARLGVLPTTACSFALASPMISPTTTGPVSIPTRTLSPVPGTPASSSETCSMSAFPARMARSASSSCDLG